MKLAQLLEWMVRHGRTLSLIMLVIMAGLVLADIIIDPSYVRYPWDRLGGFGAVYGIVSCVVIVVVSKALGYAFLYKPEDYYDDEVEHD
jgi:hypothetical protein